MTTDRLGGTTYTSPNVDRVPGQQAVDDPVSRRRERAEPVQQRRDRRAHIEQEYYVGLRAGRVARPARTDAELRPALRLLHAAARGRQPDRQVQHRHRRDRSEHDAALQVEEEQLPAAAVGATYAPTTKTVFRGGFGIFVGPGQTEDQIQPIESDRISSTLRAAAARVPGRPGAARRELRQQPEQPPVPAARLRQRVHDPGAGLPVHRLGAAGARRQHGRDRRLRRQPGTQPVPAQRRQPDRSACQPERRGRGVVIREFSIVSATPTAPITGVQNAVRRGRLQDQRRPRQLQRDAAVADPPRRRTAVDERAVHARPQQGQHRRVERSARPPATTRARSPTSTTTTATTTSTSATPST